MKIDTLTLKHLFSRKMAIYASGILIVMALYVVSYGPGMVFWENKVFLPQVGYFIYSPVEALRRWNYYIYYITEKPYIYCGGKTIQYERSNFSNAWRRDILWFGSGAVKGDILWHGNDIARNQCFYEDGRILEYTIVSDSHRKTELFYPSGQVAVSIENTPSIILETHYSPSGQVLCDGSKDKKSQHLNGSLIVKSDTGFTRKFYQDGVIVKEEDCTTQDVKDFWNVILYSKDEWIWK